MDLTAIIITVFSALFGGGIGSVLTFKATRKKASAEAKGSELDNVEKAIVPWRETVEFLRKEIELTRDGYDEVSKLVGELRKDIQKLNNTNQKIVKLLDKISHENLEKTVEEMKQVIAKQDA